MSLILHSCAYENRTVINEVHSQSSSAETLRNVILGRHELIDHFNKKKNHRTNLFLWISYELHGSD